MLDLYDIMLIKEKNGGDKLLYFQFGKHDFIFRLLSPKEYTQCKLLTANNYELNDAICQLTLIYPENISFAEYGLGCLSDEIAEVIIDKSLIFRDLEVLIKFEDEQEQINRFIPQCILFVKAAFMSDYTLEEIENWSYEKLMKMTAKAERILQLRGAVDPNTGEAIKLNYEIDEEKVNKPKSEMTTEEMLKKGIDPMFYHAHKIILKKPYIDLPVILGSNWKDKELSDSVGRQILGRQ